MTMPSRLSRSPFSTASSTNASVMGGSLSGRLDYRGFIVDLHDPVVLDGADHLIGPGHDLLAVAQAGENFGVRSAVDARFHLVKDTFEDVVFPGDHEYARQLLFVGFDSRRVGIQRLVLAGIEIAFGAHGKRLDLNGKDVLARCRGDF